MQQERGSWFFNVDYDANQLDADMEGMILEEDTNFFNTIEGVGFLEVEIQGQTTCD